jgi:hypothetical protein
MERRTSKLRMPQMANLKKGDEVRMKGGEVRPKRKRKARTTGVIVGETRSGTFWYVKWDDITEPDMLSKNDVELLHR